MEKNIMNTKKEIKNFVIEYYSGRLERPYNRKIYLTDEDYVELKILRNYGILIIALYLDNSKTSEVFNCGLVHDWETILRRIKKSFKGCIAEDEAFNCGAKYLAKLKKVYSLL